MGGVIKVPLKDIDKIKALRNGLTVSAIVAVSILPAQSMNKMPENNVQNHQTTISINPEEAKISEDTLDLESAFNELFPPSPESQSVKKEFSSLSLSEMQDDNNLDYNIDRLRILIHNDKYISYMNKENRTEEENNYIQFYENAHKDIFKEKCTQDEYNEIDMLSFVNDEILEYSENRIKNTVDNFNPKGKVIDPDSYYMSQIHAIADKLDGFDQQKNKQIENKNIPVSMLLQQRSR